MRVQTQHSSQKTLASILSLHNDMALSALIILHLGYSKQLGYHTCGIQRVLYYAVHKDCEQKNVNASYYYY